MKKVDIWLLKFSLVLLLAFLLFCFTCLPRARTKFSSLRAFSLLAELQSFGPRIPDSTAHSDALNFIRNQLLINNWTVQVFSVQIDGHTCHNLLATRGMAQPSLLLASHYDSRLQSDRDPNPQFHTLPVPGANDGGSSTVTLLELSRILSSEESQNIGLVFFDLEDQGDIEGWEWILGSRQFAKMDQYRPDLLILLDMVGGFDQVIQPPSNSDKLAYQDIQLVSAKFGYQAHFANPAVYGILDDHVPFLDAGVSAVDLIDIIDPHWHTSHDDIENVSLSSLQRIGDTLYEYINIRNLKNGY